MRRRYRCLLLLYFLLLPSHYPCRSVVHATWRRRSNENDPTEDRETTTGEKKNNDPPPPPAPRPTIEEASSTFWNFSSYFQSKVREHHEQIKEDIRAIPDDVYNEIQYHRTQFYEDLTQAKNDFIKEVKKSQQEFKNRILQDVFSQRMGWERLRHSIRDHLGVALGVWITFRGQVEPRLAALPSKGGGGSIALQLAQLIWHILEIHTQLWHSPWLHDLLSIVMAHWIWKRVLPQSPHQLQQGLPYVLFPTVLLPFWSIVLEEWTQDTADKAPFVFVLLAVTSTFGGLKALQIPIPLAASSLSGAVLTYESMRAEIAGNYVRMLEMLVKLIVPTVRFLRRVITILWRPALWVWRKWIKHMMREILWPEATRNLWGQTVRTFRKTWRIITKPIHTLRQAVADHPYVRAINEFVLGLRRGLRPVFVPLCLAIWGVAVQMDYIQGIGGVWKIFRLSLDPVAFMRGKVKGFFSPESRARKWVIQTLRSILRLLKRLLISNQNNQQPAAAAPPPPPLQPPPMRSKQRFSNPFKRTKTV